MEFKAGNALELLELMFGFREEAVF